MTQQIKVPYITDGSTYIVIVYENKTYNVKKATHRKFDEILEDLKNGNHQDALKKSDIVTEMKEFLGGKIAIKNGVLEYEDTPINTTLTQKILSMFNEGSDIEPMVNFLNNLMQNPSYTSVIELYDFLETSKMPITPDGYFLAYKKVRSDYKDIYTGSIDNSPGQTVKTTRNAVDDNRHNTCSQGLHFAAASYLPHYGSCTDGNRVVLLKINPAHVVSIPVDYNFAKGRAHEYQVLADVTDAVGTFEKGKTVADVKSYKPEVKSE